MSTDITQAAEKTPTDSPETTGGGRIYHPLTDIVETDQGVSMMLEMPGVAADTVEITLENRVLTIRGEVDPVRPEPQGDVVDLPGKVERKDHERGTTA